MKRLLFFFSVFITLILPSCVTLSQDPTMNVNQIQTTVNLSQANFKIVKMVNGSCTRSYFLGLGGGELKENAISNLLQNANIKGSQAIINTNVSVQTKYMLCGLYTEFTATATAIVIEFTDGSPTNSSNTETEVKEIVETKNESKDTANLIVDNINVTEDVETEPEITINPKAKLSEVLASNVRKPFVWDANINPVVMSVSFLENGTIKETTIESSISPEIDNEAMRLTKYAEQWVKLNLKKNKKIDLSKPLTVLFFIKKA